MPNQPRNGNWKRVWDAREEALKSVLGPATNQVFHAVQPFYLGGFADVLEFPSFVPGRTYATADLTGEDVGQKPGRLGNYELMICALEPLPSAANLISKLARYTCDAVLEAGQTMDLPGFFGDSTIRALLFAHPRGEPVTFSFLGQSYSLLLCMGVTAEELAFGRSQGTARLLTALKKYGAFPYTTPNRATIPL
jgi:hypothetical protein